MASLFPVHGETLEFAKVMNSAGFLEDWEYYFEKPHKWETEYNLWAALGRPHFDDEGGTFNEFVDEINKMYDQVK